MGRAATCGMFFFSPLRDPGDDDVELMIRTEIGFAGYQKPEELNQNKFLLDIDGNGWR